MKRTFWWTWFLVAAPLWGAPGQGGGLVRVDQGCLDRVECWWNSGDQVQGRWWWDPDSGGSAWARIGGLQVGPLVVGQGDEGMRSWSRGSALRSGHWGLGWEGDAGGLWAIQGPDTFNAGAQVRLVAPALTLAAGADRTWALGLPDPEAGAWSDRARWGLGWAQGPLSLGAEAGILVPAQGLLGWESRGRASFLWDDGEVRGTGQAEKGPDGLSWAGSARWRWREAVLGWKGKAADPQGRIEASWEAPWGTVGLSWAGGPGGRCSGSLGLGALRLEASLDGQWEGPSATGHGRLGASGPWETGRWSASWALGPGDRAPVQSVTAGWKDPVWEAEGRWQVEGLVLGWLGPRSSFRLELGYRF